MVDLKREVLRTFSIAEAYREAKEVIEAAQFKLSDFEKSSGGDGIYDKTKIQKDNAFVERVESAGSTGDLQQEQLAHIAEAIFDERMERGWLGKGAVVYKTSKLDDIRHGVDSVIGFEGDTDMLAVDVTYSTQEALETKLRDIRWSIAGIESTKQNRGALREVEYFESDVTPGKKALKDIPVLVMGVDSANTKQLMQIWMQISEGMVNTKVLDNHEKKAHVLGMMRMQLEHYRRYAKGNNRVDLAETYGRHLSRIEKIISDSGWTIDYEKLAEEDKVFQAMKEYLEKNFK